MREITLSRFSRQGGAFRDAATRHRQNMGRLQFHFRWCGTDHVSLAFNPLVKMAALRLRHLRGGIA